jgi:hypothetical protein
VHSEQKRGDVVTNGTHCGIAVSSTKSIAAGEKQVIDVLASGECFVFYYYVAVPELHKCFLSEVVAL